jgi:hypothetical protein
VTIEKKEFKEIRGNLRTLEEIGTGIFHIPSGIQSIPLGMKSIPFGMRFIPE